MTLLERISACLYLLADNLFFRPTLLGWLLYVGLPVLALIFAVGFFEEKLWIAPLLTVVFALACGLLILGKQFFIINEYSIPFFAALLPGIVLCSLLLTGAAAAICRFRANR